jgi:hypothetical protein
MLAFLAATGAPSRWTRVEIAQLDKYFKIKKTLLENKKKPFGKYYDFAGTQ